MRHINHQVRASFIGNFKNSVKKSRAVWKSDDSITAQDFLFPFGYRVIKDSRISG